MRWFRLHVRVIALLTILVMSPITSASSPAPTQIAPLVSGDEPIVVTQHVIQTPNGPLEYEALAGRLPIRVDETGEVHAHVFFVAYVAKNRGANRPLTFAWNGGPTIPSIYLHTQALGPRLLTANGFVDNPITLLSTTDLVFYDPVETGFSRPAKPEFAAEFLTMKGDIAAASEFVRAYRARFGGETQPLFILGESYGAWRAAGVADFLVKRGVDLAGLVLVSGGFAGLKTSIAFGQAMNVQARTATAFYYKRLPPDLMRDRDATIKMVNDWVNSTYLPALSHPDALSAKDRSAVVMDLARFTGVRPDQIDPETMTMSTRDFLWGFFGGKKVLSDLDMRIVGDVPENPKRALYISQYLRGELGYATDLGYSGELGYNTNLPYRAIEAGYVPALDLARRSTGMQWFYNQSDNASAALAKDIPTGDFFDLAAENPPWITNAMNADTRLRVFTATGRYDPTNQCEGLAVSTAKLDASLTKRIINRCYEGGHMMYNDPSTRAALMRDISTFMGDTIHDDARSPAK
jgi:carboxypeptidase C (cathepsin A)